MTTIEGGKIMRREVVKVRSRLLQRKLLLSLSCPMQKFLIGGLGPSP